MTQGGILSCSLRFLLAAALAVATAVPAAANPDSNRLSMTGVFSGTAYVGKTIISGSCNNSGYALILGGGGLGLPQFKRNKTLWWALAANLTTFPQGAGFFEACGRMASAFTVGEAAVGAACLASSGHDGFGRIDLNGLQNDKKLQNLSWVTSVGDVLPWTARTSEGAAKTPGGHFAGLVWMTGGLPCLEKSPTDPKPASALGSGATGVVMVGAFSILN